MGRKKGEIVITFKEKEEHLLFSIQDNGIGIEDSMEVKERNSLGMKLIKTLAKQLNAKMKVVSKPGTRFEFKFRKEE